MAAGESAGAHAGAADTGKYERFGWYYAALTDGRFRPGEREFYLSLAGGGPVLEPACGAGRVLHALAAAGIEVWGTDSSAAMLRLAHRRLADTPATTTLVHQPLQRLELGRRFPLILLPLDTVRLLRDAAEQARFFAAAARHLQPGGRLALDVTLPEGEVWQPQSLPPRTGPDGSEVAAVSRRRRAGDEVIEETHYSLLLPDGRRFGESWSERYRVVTAAEVWDLLVGAGLRVEGTWSNHSRRPFYPGDPLLVTTAVLDPPGAGGVAADEPNRGRP